MIYCFDFCKIFIPISLGGVFGFIFVFLCTIFLLPFFIFLCQVITLEHNLVKLLLPKKKRSSPQNQWVCGPQNRDQTKCKQVGIHHKSVELWFHIIIWCHPKMVTPGAGRPSRPPLATPLLQNLSTFKAKNRGKPERERKEKRKSSSHLKLGWYRISNYFEISNRVKYFLRHLIVVE